MLTDTAFLQATYVSELYLSGLQLGTSTPPNVFKELKFLTVLSLEKNDITDEIIENLVNPQPNTLTTLSFKGNKIAQIHRLAVTGEFVHTTFPSIPFPSPNHLMSARTPRLHDLNLKPRMTRANPMHSYYCSHVS